MLVTRGKTCAGNSSIYHRVEKQTMRVVTSSMHDKLALYNEIRYVKKTRAARTLTNIFKRCKIADLINDLWPFSYVCGSRSTRRSMLLPPELQIRSSLENWTRFWGPKCCVHAEEVAFCVTVAYITCYLTCNKVTIAVWACLTSIDSRALYLSPIVACIFQRYVSSLVYHVTTIPPREQLPLLAIWLLEIFCDKRYGKR